MTQDDVIRMAKTVGDVSTDSRGRMDFCFDEYGLLALVKFAAEHEREACAKVCEDLYAEDESVSVGECVAAIIARGEQA